MWAIKNNNSLLIYCCTFPNVFSIIEETFGLNRDKQSLYLMVRSFLDVIFTFVVLIRRWLTHSQERQEQLFHRKMPLFSESTKSFLCENSGFSLDFTLPKIGGE